MTLSSSHAFPRHSHDEFGIGVMLSGAQRSWSVVGQVEAVAGEVIMVNPGEIHDGMAVGERRAWRIAYLDPAILRRAAAEESDAEVIARPVARDAGLARRVERFFSLLDDPDPEAAEEILMACLARVVDRHGVQGSRKRPPSPGVAPAVSRLDDAPEVPATLSELASLCGSSRFQLIRGFTREVGTTPHAYALQRRARLARRLLRTGLSPAEAATAAGFADQSHMTRAFARHFGITPARYRDAFP